jgi:hypothetical protein
MQIYIKRKKSKVERMVISGWSELEKYFDCFSLSRIRFLLYPLLVTFFLLSSYFSPLYHLQLWFEVNWFGDLKTKFSLSTLN